MTTELPVEGAAVAAKTEAKTAVDAPPTSAAAASDDKSNNAALLDATTAAQTRIETPSGGLENDFEPNDVTEASKEATTATNNDANADGLNADDANPDPDNKKRAPKKKFALFVAYVGAGFAGMQYNKDQQTIEGTLRDALVSSGLVSESNADAFSKIAWSRAARTDKGVSAVGQVVAARLQVPLGGKIESIADSEEEIARLVNEQLPKSIRVLGARRVRNGFDARKSCDRRRYEYVLPEFAFDPSACCAKADSRGLKKKRKVEKVEGEEGAATTTTAAEAPGTTAATETEKQEEEKEEEEEAEEEPSPAAPFVFDDAARDKLNKILAQYQGTHNFHNFTVRIPHSDPSATRYIVSFSCKGVAVLPDGQRWVKLEVYGQSFILHQIRKMVGTAVAVFRGAAPEDAIASALSREADVATPMAPELGLFLAETVYSHYNSTWAGAKEEEEEEDEGGEGGEGREEGAKVEEEQKQQEQEQQNAAKQANANSCKRESLSLGAWGDAAERFKLEHVYPHIARVDAERKTNEEWLRSLNERNYHFSAWADAGRRGPHQGKRRYQMVGASRSGNSDSSRAEHRGRNDARNASGGSSGRGGRGGRGRGLGGSGKNNNFSNNTGNQNNSNRPRNPATYDDASIAAEWSD